MYHAGISSGETYRKNARNSQSHRDFREASLAKGIKWPDSVSPERVKKLCEMSSAALRFGKGGGQVGPVPRHRKSGRVEQTLTWLWNGCGQNDTVELFGLLHMF